MKYRIYIIALIMLQISCTHLTDRKKEISAKSDSDTVLAEKSNDNYVNSFPENMDPQSDNKNYTSAYEYYLEVYNQEKLMPADDILMLSITDSLFTKVRDSELFYFIVFTKSMNGSDGFYSEAVGLSCYNYITALPTRFAKYFISESKLNKNDLDNWASYIYGEIQISRENHEQEAIEELEITLTESIKDEPAEYKKIIENLIDKIKIAHNDQYGI